MLRMKDERAPKKALKGYKEGRRPVGRPRGRWIDAVDKDAKNMLKCKNWRMLACSDIGEEREYVTSQVFSRFCST